MANPGNNTGALTSCPHHTNSVDPKDLLKVDSPDLEHVLLDGEEGIPLQVLSLNLGIGGAKGSLDQVAALLALPKFRQVAVLHLQEARIRKSNVSKLQHTAAQLLLKFALYVHCMPAGMPHNTSVITMVRKELLK
jgi:hypothetical protein